MTKVTTTHEGHECVYSEDRNEWSCPDFDVKASSLTALRAKINKIDADARRVSIKLYAVDTSYLRRGEVVEAVLLDADKRNVWVMSGTGRDRQRRKVSLRALAPLTPEAAAAIEEERRLKKEFDALRAKLKAAEDAIPRVTREDLIAANPALEQILQPEAED